MTTHVEIELKQLIPKAMYEALLVTYPQGRWIHQTNHYFAYNDLNVALASRIREIDGQFTLTFKQSHPKGFLETSFELLDKDERIFERSDVRAFLQEQGFNQGFNPIGSLVTDRYLVQRPYGELCIDRNEYLKTVDYELEYELNEIDEKEAQDEFFKLLQDFHVRYQQAPSKYTRFKQMWQTL